MAGRFLPTDFWAPLPTCRKRAGGGAYVRGMPENAPVEAAPLPLSGELLADPTARAIWAALCTLEEGVKHLFLAHLRAHLAVAERETPQRTRIALAVTSLNEAHGVLMAEARASTSPGEHVPKRPPELTEPAYTGLRLTHPECGWMAPSTIRRNFGGQWNEALRAARLETVSDGEVLTSYQGPAFEWAEVRQALLDFRDFRAERHATLPGDFSLHDYYAWAKRPDILRLPGRRPRSQVPFDRFGGFLKAKAAAFAGDSAPAEDGARAVRSASVVASAPYRYTDAQMKAAVDEIVVRLERSPRAGEFQREQRKMLAEEAERDLPLRAVPVYGTIIKRWKVWDAALVASGHEPFRQVVVDPDTGRGEPNGAPRTIPEEDLLAGILEAFEAKGKPFKVKTYDSYVEEHGRVSKTGRRLATYSCVGLRYRHVSAKPWKHACDKALPPGWDQP
jgi:hypothetical protein